jgi:hypothetical protein
LTRCNEVISASRGETPLVFDKGVSPWFDS